MMHADTYVDPYIIYTTYSYNSHVPPLHTLEAYLQHWERLAVAQLVSTRLQSTTYHLHLRFFYRPSAPYSHSSPPAVSSTLSSADLIVNCTGLAPCRLLNDTHMRPVRGYLVRVSAPFLHHWLYSNTTKAYLFPRHRDCVLGGTFDVDCSDTAINDTIRNDILARCAAVVPDIRHCHILNEWVGLRPWRDMLRLELEWPGNGGVEQVEAEDRQRLDVRAAGCTVPIVHNYGAGGSGMTVHWGCAEEVVQLARRVGAPDDGASVGYGKEHGFVLSSPTSL